MFDGKRKFNSGFVGRDKVREMAIAVFRDDPGAIFDKNSALFGGIIVNGQTLKTRNNFIGFVNSDLFITNTILNFVNVY